MKGTGRITALFVPIVCLMCILSCSKERLGTDPVNERKTLILYSCGYNNLTGNLRSNMDSICTAAPYRHQSGCYKLLVYSHLAKTSSDYNTPVAPVLIDVYKDKWDHLVMDTLAVYSETESSASTATLRKVLSYIKANFPSKEYGLVFSSHGTGWLPLGYYASADDGGDIFWNSAPAPCSVPAQDESSGRRFLSSYFNPIDGDLAHPLVKSVGAAYKGTSFKLISSDEMEIVDFAAALPMKMKYIVMDACLMGGVEFAYELKDKVEYFASSQTEILSHGFTYETMPGRLLYSSDADVRGVCEDFFEYYRQRNSSATVSLVYCKALPHLAAVCRELCEKYRLQLSEVDDNKVQGYFRSNKHWFYDLEDVFVKAGISESDHALLSGALDECVLYKAATPSFLGIKINTHSGFSMYLPCNGSEELDRFYRNFLWNKDVALVN